MGQNMDNEWGKRHHWFHRYCFNFSNGLAGVQSLLDLLCGEKVPLPKDVEQLGSRHARKAMVQEHGKTPKALVIHQRDANQAIALKETHIQKISKRDKEITRVL